jgi:hypothetical protein
MSESLARLERVRAELARYEHPLFDFSAAAKDPGVSVNIVAKRPAVEGTPAYSFELHPRDLDHPQFAWQFQRQLYDALHDYLIEMFVRTPQDRPFRGASE